MSSIYEIVRNAIDFYVQIINFHFYNLQKSDSDLTFEDSFGNPLSDDKISNHLNENSRTKIVSKRSVSDDSDKLKVDDKQIESDESWMSRVKRRLSNFFSKSDDKVVQKRELDQKQIEANHSQQKSVDLTKDLKLPTRRRRDYEDDEDDDEDNEIAASGDHDTTPYPDLITPLPPVKDDKYCKIIIIIKMFIVQIIFAYFEPTVRLKLTLKEIWKEQYKNKTSSVFKELASTLKSAIEDLYEDKNTESTSIMAQVVEVR